MLGMALVGSLLICFSARGVKYSRLTSKIGQIVHLMIQA